MKKVSLLPALGTVALLLLPQLVAAQDEASAASDTSFLLPGLEITSTVLAVIAIVMIALVIRQFGTSVISVIFGYFLVGTLLLACSRLFIFLTDMGVISASENTMMVSWHVIFYLAMITFIIAGNALTKIGSAQEVTQSFSKVLGWGLFAGVITLALFLTAGAIDKPFDAMFTGSLIDTLGVAHFVAVLLGGWAAFYVSSKAKLGQITAQLAIPYLIGFGLLGLNHLWELVMESWKLIHLESATIETVEQFFVVPAFLLFAYAYIRLWTLVRSHA